MSAFTEVKTAIERVGRARAEMAILLLLTALAGALSSVWLLRHGVEWMWLRYGVSVFPAYLTFFALVGLWVRANRSHEPRSTIRDADRPDSELLNPFDLLQAVPDFGEGCAVIFFVLLLAGVALIAVAAIYFAPEFLAELLLEAAFARSLFRRLRGLPAAGWPLLLLRRTLVVAVFASCVFAGIGAALQEYAPEARSIGGVIKHGRTAR
jgi:hypothetical protein